MLAVEVHSAVVVGVSFVAVVRSDFEFGLDLAVVHDFGSTVVAELALSSD